MREVGAVEAPRAAPPGRRRRAARTALEDLARRCSRDAGHVDVGAQRVRRAPGPRRPAGARGAARALTPPPSMPLDQAVDLLGAQRLAHPVGDQPGRGARRSPRAPPGRSRAACARWRPGRRCRARGPPAARAPRSRCTFTTSAWRPVAVKCAVGGDRVLGGHPHDAQVLERRRRRVLPGAGRVDHPAAAEAAGRAARRRPGRAPAGRPCRRCPRSAAPLST